MELDELKSLWQKQKPSGKAHSEHDIRAILEQKTHPILRKIYYKFFIELGISSVVIAAMIGVYIYMREYGLAVIAALLTIAMGGGYVFLYKKININFSRDSLNAALTKMEHLFKVYDKLLALTRYFLMGGYLVGFIIGNFINPRSFEVNTKFWIGLGAVVPFSLLFSYPLKWMIDRVYGQHIRELKSAYVELNELDKEA